MGFFITFFITFFYSISAVSDTLPDPRSDIIPRTKEELIRISKITLPTTNFSQAEKFENNSAGETTARILKNTNAFSQNSANLSFKSELDFKLGNALFRKLWVSSPSSTLASDGLGPIFNARSCQRCHLKDGRGHPPKNGSDSTVSFVIQLVRPEFNSKWKDEIEGYLGGLPDPTYGNQLQEFTTAGIRAEGSFEIEHINTEVYLADGTIVKLQEPIYKVKNLGYGKLHSETIIAPRIAPQMIGLGLLEEIPNADIIKLSDPNDRNRDGISGRANYVYSRDLNEITLGRFGLKATSATLKDQSAVAFFNDIGISSSLYPEGYGDCTNQQSLCQNAPNGNTQVHNDVEISDQALDLTVFYTQNLAVPKRRNSDDPDVLWGKKIFYKSGCISCHNPKFVTNRLKEKTAQSFQLIWPYTDMLLHDMGDRLADNATAGRASGNEWRTPPLWGIGLTNQVSGHTQFLHDGRARNLLEAILWHGGEAESSRNKVVELNKKDRDSLILFLESL